MKIGSLALRLLVLTDNKPQRTKLWTALTDCRKKERKIVLHAYRHSAGARTVRRALVLVLLGRGWSYRQIADAALVSHDTIADVKRGHLDNGVEAVLGQAKKQEIVRLLVDHRASLVVVTHIARLRFFPPALVLRDAFPAPA